MTDLDRHVPMPPYFGSLQSHPEPQMLGKDDEDEPDDDEEEEPDEEPDADPDDDLDEDSVRAELRKVRGALKKANDSSARHRKRRREAEAARQEKDEKPKGDEADVETRISAARAEERAKADQRAKASEVRGALRGAGVADERVARLARLIDLDDLDVNDDGTVDGLDEAIDALRDDMPEAFERPRRRRRSAAGAGDQGGESERNRRSEADKNMSASERQAKALLGGK